jgi:hypothetical protein
VGFAGLSLLVHPLRPFVPAVRLQRSCLFTAVTLLLLLLLDEWGMYQRPRQQGVYVLCVCVVSRLYRRLVSPFTRLIRSKSNQHTLHACIGLHAFNNRCCDCQCGEGGLNTCKAAVKRAGPHNETASTVFQCRALIKRAPMERFLVYATISLASLPPKIDATSASCL